jgi:hypothetical protein
MQDTLAELIEGHREDRGTDATAETWTEIVRLSIADQLMIGDARFGGRWLLGQEEPKYVAALRPKPAMEVSVWAEIERKTRVNALALVFHGPKGKIEELSPYVSSQDELVVFDRTAAADAWQLGGPNTMAIIEGKGATPEQLEKARVALEKAGLSCTGTRGDRLIFEGVTDAQFSKGTALAQKIHRDLAMVYITTQMEKEIPKLLSAKKPFALLTHPKKKAPWGVALKPASQWGDFWQAHALSNRIWVLDFQGENEFAPHPNVTPKKPAKKKTTAKKR